jgi:hypothetical protein
VISTPCSLLLASGAGRVKGSAREPGLSVDVGRDTGAEAGVDQKIALRVGNQDCGRSEGALVAERSAREGKGRPGLIGAGRQLVDRHVWR